MEVAAEVLLGIYARAWSHSVEVIVLLKPILYLLSKSFTNVLFPFRLARRTITGIERKNEEKIQEVTTEIGDEIDVKLEGLTEDVNGLTEEVNGLSEEVNGLSEDVEEVQNDVEEIDLVVSSALNDLNTRIISNEDKIQELTTEIGDEIDVKLEGLTEEVNGLSEDVEEVQNDVQEIDLVVSSALNDLNTRIISNEEKIGELDGDVDEKFEEFEEEINGKIVDVKNYVINMELVISSALNDLNTRIIQIVNRLNQMNP